MPYQKKTILAILQELNNTIYLPAIQRKYVWKEEQMEKLMDSLLLGYPIGTFLFWKVPGKVINEKGYSLYEFIKNYHERDCAINPHAPKPITKEKIHAVLDGQQRLTTLFIALQGTLAMKMPMKRWDNDNAFPKKELYFNLKSQKRNEEEEITYEFKFLKEEDIKKDESKLWFKTKDILTIKTEVELMQFIIKNKWENDNLIVKNISTLYKYLVVDEIINYFEIERDSIDEVLDIFVRVNSGGTVLSKTDLLFSTIVSHWDNAREKIEELLKTINKYGEGYRFDNDFIMRTCLFLLDFSIYLKVETFKKDNVFKIKERFEDIKAAIITMVGFLDEWGFRSENIISYNATIPIVYYIFMGGKLDNKSKDELRKYYIIAQLKQIFGTASNTALNNIRDIMKGKTDKFEMTELQSLRFVGDRTFRFDEEEIDALFDLEKGAYTFMVLSLLYPNLKFNKQTFHQDHMHPYNDFKDGNLEEKKIPKEKWEKWKIDRNKLANLQLLEGKENESKNDTPLADWLKIKENRENVKYLPENISYDLKDFETFMEKRKELMKEELKKILLSK